ncbi:lytic polysaccharide monooxygenase auxiliary activity family 9 protein [Streptomyces sp. NBC_00557]|uniref:lytic polysaccharide monooxygenase auxiliary activity family 9 protein n=1 Tax=Streptomyces sp. NBC_00557 TaxID=2975776 RepID=UPI002E814B1B|nr:lytic polysaccharide monooxygenase [Streptomyces sp. NBC_00557]WUC37946.1 lytic polysaccharide monooxygenase [Streptomyces sp. NBC_00557]
MPARARRTPARARRTPARARRGAAVAAVLGAVPLALTALAAAPASAHGSMGDPVSRVAQCYAEGPQSPRSAACRAAVAAGGTQALYDWNGVRIGDAAGQHRKLIPDGKLCSADNEEFKGLDLARADWPATSVHSGSYTFRYRVTAPHKGTFTVYLTKPGYDPAEPLSWSALDLEHPVATATDPVASGGFSSFSGTLPERSGRQLLYAVWQRSDSPEAFYSCSDVDFGGSGARDSSPAPAASAPSDRQIAAGAGRSTMRHHGHGSDRTAAPAAPPSTAPNRPQAAGTSQDLAETGASPVTSYVAIGGAAAMALGSAALFLSVRRHAADGGRRR